MHYTDSLQASPQEISIATNSPYKQEMLPVSSAKSSLQTDDYYSVALTIRTTQGPGTNVWTIENLENQRDLLTYTFLLG